MLNIPKHRKIMFDIIRDIYQSPAGIYLGFKGGTMLYFFYELDRFSVDLDFDLLDESKKEEVYSGIRKILQAYGKIKDETDKNFNLFFLLSYKEGSPGIKIEISKRNSEKSAYELKNFYGIDVNVMKLRDAFANKLVASVERKRTANRDFYDIYFLLRKNVSFNEDIIFERTGKNSRDFFVYLREYFEKKRPERGILEGLGELLDEKRKQWVKDNLKKELLASLDFSISQIRKD
jgi:predicted nucleotidyltransferase component of viral defense system